MPTALNNRVTICCDHCRFPYESEVKKGDFFGSTAWKLALGCEMSVLGDFSRFKPKILVPGDMRCLHQIPTGSVDLAVLDPPYFISTSQKIYRGRNKMKFKGADLDLHKGEWDDASRVGSKLLLPTQDALESISKEAVAIYPPVLSDKEIRHEMEAWAFMTEWFSEVDRVLHPGAAAVIFYDRGRASVVNLLMEWYYGYKTKGSFAMCKSAPVPQARKQKLANGWEMAVIAMKPIPPELKDRKPELFRYNWQEGHCADFGVGGRATSEERFATPAVKDDEGNELFPRDPGHTTAKPLWAIKRLIRWWSKPGDVVLDGFSGSGPGLECGYLLGRKMWSVEIDPQWMSRLASRAEKTEKYLADHNVSLRLQKW